MLLVVESVLRAEEANSETSNACSSSMILWRGCCSPEDTMDEMERPVAEIPEIVCENACEDADADVDGVDVDEVPEVACVPFLREASLEEESMVRSPEGMLEAKGAGLVGTANAVDIQDWGSEDGLARRKKVLALEQCPFL